MTKYEPGQWYGWNGGECPVHPETKVSSATPNGIRPAKPARNLEWDGESVNRVVAFMIIREHREPREWWITKCNGYTHPHDTLEAAQTYCRCNASMNPNIIHIREVIDGEEQA